MKFLIGCDPEFFLKEGDKIIPACGTIPGTKDKPFKVEKGAVQVDGLATEFNIDPASTEDEFVINIDTVIGELKKLIPKNTDLSDTVSYSFEEVWKDIPYGSRRLGCDPDFDAYNEGERAVPNYLKKSTYRHVGGHIHIGWTKDQDIVSPTHLHACKELSKQLDYFLFLPSLLLDQKSEDRVAFYGQPGIFRPKPYGMEYRSLSNFWVLNEKLRRWVYRSVDKAIDEYVEKDNYYPAKYGETYIHTILYNLGNYKSKSKTLQTLATIKYFEQVYELYKDAI